VTAVTTTIRSQQRDVEDQTGTSISRRVAIEGVIFLGTAAPLAVSMPVSMDNGTRVGQFTDATTALNSTSLRTTELGPGGLAPFVEPTTMERIRTLAPLSLRDWGSVFGVSHTAVRSWLRDDPEREKLATVLSALEEAYASKPNLAAWLVTSLPGLEVRPLDLLRDDRWRAFRGALRAQAAPPPSLSRDELEARRRAETSWALADVEIEPDEA